MMNKGGVAFCDDTGGKGGAEDEVGMPITCFRKLDLNFCLI